MSSDDAKAKKSFKRSTKESKKPKRSETEIFNLLGYDLTPANSRKFAAEFVATTLFVWVGCSTAVSSQAMLAFDPNATNDNTFLVAVSLAFGIAIAVLAYTIAPISGGHINPAVTLAFVVLGDMDPITGSLYCFAQCMGALLGAALVWGSTASSTLMDLNGNNDAPPFLIGANSVSADLPLGSAFLGECIGTFLLVWTVLMTAVNKKSIAGNLAPIAIGWSVLLAHLALVPLTGCGINPARSFGPMLVVIMAGEKIGFEGWWIYYTAPFVGAVAAAFVCKYVFEVLTDDDDDTAASAADAIQAEFAAKEPEISEDT